MRVTLWHKETGEAKAVHACDAKEILEVSGDLYTDVDPDTGDHSLPETPERGDRDYRAMTKADLREFALIRHNVQLPTSLNTKAKLISAIRALDRGEPWKGAAGR